MNKLLTDSIETVASLIVVDPNKGYELLDDMLVVAEREKCKTEYGSRVMDRVAGIHGEISVENAEEQGRAIIFVRGPNESNELVREIGAEVAQRRLAVNFGGIVSVVEHGKSATHSVKQRDERGEVMRDADGDPLTEPATIMRAVPMTPPTAHNKTLDACALFVKTRNGLKDTALPPGLAPRMINGWANTLPPLKGLATFPVWHNGKLLTGTGYHEETRLWLQTNDFDAKPFGTPEDAVNFLRDEWLVDFPFAGDRDLAAALMLPVSLMMSRTTLSSEAGPPLGLFTAPAAGTGKSLLCLALIAATTGSIPGSMGYPDSEDEREKRITAAVMEGNAALLLDNLKSGSFIGRGDVTLTKLVTDIEFEGRVLGASKTFRGPAGIVPVATGNNIVVDGDMARRTLECRLVAPEDENLALRTYRHPNLLNWTIDNRDRILGAYQTILQAEVKAENPIGGFPAWSCKVAHPILAALNMPIKEFFQPWIDAAEEDAKGVQMRGVYELAIAIAALRTNDRVQPIEGSWFTAAEIVTGITEGGASHVLLPGGYETALDARNLAFLLKRNADCTYDGEKGTFRIQTTRMNLGKRTNRQEKPVFRVKRERGDAPSMPMDRHAELHKLVRGED
ncbi:MULTISPECIES: hypothetical protein [unclassified Ruegeria]|uniref:hypothetical protein n=1 Tax=unclassified Ruegeria TaxID=2625375 RepID=UPI00149137C1|nr:MULTISPECIES: hypothetical protein [unclassified Ruegeria]NOD37108.1 hypothetical protein [Ruegeria sp. HKCCD7296]NOE44283.1 hypothetical protein [Ruegeria sp. HKCCD7319]